MLFKLFYLRSVYLYNWFSKKVNISKYSNPNKQEHCIAVLGQSFSICCAKKKGRLYVGCYATRAIASKRKGKIFAVTLEHTFGFKKPFGIKKLWPQILYPLTVLC